MKSTVLYILATGLFLAAAAAAPPIVVDSVVTEYLYREGSDYPIGTKVLGRSRTLTESGQRSVTRAGSYEYAVTPTLRRDGKIAVSQSVTRLTGKGSPRTFEPTTSPLAPGTSAGLTIGLVGFSTKVSLKRGR